MGYNLLARETPIIPVLVGDEEKAIEMSGFLAIKGVFAPAIRPPTVSPGTSRIRATVMAVHTREDLDRALRAFEEAGREAGIIWGR